MNGHKKLVVSRAAIFIVVVLLILSGSGETCFGGSSTKTFDFGAGGDNPTFRSHSRRFAAPENVAIVVAVNYRTTGETGVAIVVEIKDEANQTLTSREVTAEKTAKRLVINIAAAENKIHGCEKFWQVRVRSKSGEIPTARIFGYITFSFVDLAAIQIDVEDKSINLAKGKQMTINVGNAGSFNHPGVITFRASWLHSLIDLVLPLKFELIRPDESIAKTLVGYALNSSGRPRLDFSHHITLAEAEQTGAWKLRISNETEHDIIKIKPTVTFTKKCFE
ncbi:MAG: hypothetical protein H0X72_11510 [Acidobacteria bacterium]|jgi:hypothetical protein|nr:hypothetical protein [Acidobacteriota bacterium]